jgi:hypothetical protein
LALLVPGCRAERPLPDSSHAPRLVLPPAQADAIRDEVLARAQVRRPPDQAIEDVDFRLNPAGPDAIPPSAELTCRFEIKPSEGRSPKFQCRLPSGESVKVKYGRTNAETRSEVAGSRLLTALGYGADRMYVVQRIRCYGCPRYPYPRFSWFDSLFVDYGRFFDFDFAVIERPMEGLRLETHDRKGWGWYELDKIDPARGGATPDERDAFRLLAAFLNHWDNKTENQRLVCLPDPNPAPDPCPRPFLVIQDLGADFGPWGMDLDGWRSHPVWNDAQTCRLSMKSLPFGGSTFHDVQIGDAGRRLLLGLLERLSETQVRALFVGARFTEPRHGPPESGDIAGWVQVFEDRVRQIAQAGPCP